MSNQTPIPETLGRFRILERLGSGSQGTVFRARDPMLERDVAIKVASTERSDVPTLQGPSPLEARAAARLRHPNIVPIYEIGEHEGSPFLVFELVKGRTLRESLAGGRALPVARAAALMRSVLDGVAHAHEHGVVHLDLTPRNILVDEHDVPRIMDFGLARMAGVGSDTPDCPLGTLLYMAPEHFLERPLGPYTDVFALCAIFYQMVMGKPPFAAGSTMETIRCIVHDAVDLAPLGRSEEGERVAVLLQGGLEKDPAARYADALAMKKAFAALFPRTPAAGPAKQHGTVEFLLRRMQRRRDFPALSQSLVAINRMAVADGNASARQVANVILRDYALTNKLLKLANSAFYGSVAGEVRSISQAVCVLGFEQVRLAASALAFFSHLQSGSGDGLLRDALLRAFVSGLITRHLAQRARLECAEEAFICGMFQNLGENLTIYYFPEEYREIRVLLEERELTKAAASRAILGVSYAELGVAVARDWKFPDLIVQTIASRPEREGSHDDSPTARLRELALFANGICDVAGEAGGKDDAMDVYVECMGPRVGVKPKLVLPLLAAALEKLEQYAGVLGIRIEQSEFCAALREWVCKRQRRAQERRAEPAMESFVRAPDPTAATAPIADSATPRSGGLLQRILGRGAVQ